MEKTNILWLFCEDVCPWMSMFGDDTVETPNLCKLAEDGVVFENCYSPAPVCSPARSGIINGCYPATIGVQNHVSSRINEPPINLDVKSLPQIFKENGYYTYNFGKDDYNFNYKREDLYSGDYVLNGFYGFEGTNGDWSDRGKDQPFFGQITLWGGKNKKPQVKQADPNKVKVNSYYPDTELFKEQYINHYNQIMITDDEVGEIVKRLKDEGLYDNTAIFFFSDHGYCLLRHKQFLYDGGIHVPLIIKLPKGDLKGTIRRDMVSSLDVFATSLSLAGISLPKKSDSKDLFASDYKRDYVVSARDRCDFTIDRIRSVRTNEYKYIRNFMTDRPLMQAQYRDRTPQYKEWFELKEQGKLNENQLKAVMDERPAEELYHLKYDPEELNNLAEKSEYKEILEQMRKDLDEWIEMTGDKPYQEDDEQLKVLLERWGEDRCINPEYDKLKGKN